MSNKTRSYIGKTSSTSTSSRPHRKTQGWKTAEKASLKSLTFEDDHETEKADHPKKILAEKKKRKRAEDVTVEEDDCLEESDLDIETDEEHENKGEDSKEVAGSQIDLAKLSEEFRARRANKSAKVIEPIVDARQSVLSRWERMDAQMTERIECLRISLAPTKLDISTYLSLGAQRELASQTLCTAYERCTGQLVPEFLQLADNDLNSLNKRVGYVRKEKKKHFASTKKKMNAIQTEQKAITDSHDLLRNFSAIFQKYRPSTDSDFRSKGKPGPGGGFLSSIHDRSIKPKNIGVMGRVSRPTLHQLL